MGTSEENQAIGKFTLRHLDRRMKLLEVARGSRRWNWISSLIGASSFPVILAVVTIFFPHTSYLTTIVLALVPELFVIGVDVRRAHSRLDALVQLVGEENLLND